MTTRNYRRLEEMTIRPSGSSHLLNGSVLKVERPYYEQEQLNDELHYCTPEEEIKPSVCSKFKKIKPTKVLFSMFPILVWISDYKFKNDIIGDIISGCTVAIMHIPQGMGYAMLANIPPIIGIYTAFFPVLIYFLLGTSRHNSMGTFAVISIMVGKSVMKYATDQIEIHSHDGATISEHERYATDLPHYTSVQVVTSICLVVGIIQLIMYLMRLGVISTLLSDILVSGFTTGAGIHVLTSQVKDLLGVSVTPRDNFKIILNFMEFFQKFNEINWTAVLISIITITILIINNEWLKPRISKMCIIPVPIELIAVVAGTVFSKFLDLKDNYHIKTIGHIPTGFPSFEPPNLELARLLILDGFIVAMVSYTVSISMALIFAQKLNYEVDSNQELLAMGAGNILGSFFSCLPVSASLSRTAIQEATGGKTQIASIISCSILTFVLLWIGPFFEDLPRCVLASVVVVALKGMLWQVAHFFQFWKLSRLDAFVWLVTFLTVVIVAIDIGLLVGIVLSLSCIFIRGMKPYTCLLGHIPKTDLYLDVNRYKAAEEINNIKIFHYCGSLNFATRSSFKSELCTLIDIDLAQEVRNKAASHARVYEPIRLKCLIIDFSALSYIDPSGVNSLKHLMNEFNKLSIIVYIAAASCPAYEMMKKCDLRESSSQLFKYFPTIHDAVHHAMTNLTPISVITDNVDGKK